MCTQKGLQHDPGKVVVLGIDGLPYSLIERYIEMEAMPNGKAVIGQGSLSRMRSTLPEVSSVAWTSFMTGDNPGTHGIFGFMELDHQYGYRFPTYADIKTRTLWEKLDVPAVVINIPETYPAVRPFNGVMVSGRRREGIFFGLFNFGEQIATGMSLLIVGVLIDSFAGLIPGQVSQSALTIERIGILYSLLPAFLLVLAAIICTVRRLWIRSGR